MLHTMHMCNFFQLKIKFEVSFLSKERQQRLSGRNSETSHMVEKLGILLVPSLIVIIDLDEHTE